MKIKNYQKILTKQIARFGDIRFTGQIVFLVIVLLIFWSGVRAVQSNYSLQQQVAQVKQQNQVAELENSTINLQNKYYSSNQYLELSARQNFGLASPGEKELIVPQNVALSYTVNMPNISSTGNTVTSAKKQSNYKTWVDFFLHRYSNR